MNLEKNLDDNKFKILPLVPFNYNPMFKENLFIKNKTPNLNSKDYRLYNILLNSMIIGYLHILVYKVFF